MSISDLGEVTEKSLLEAQNLSPFRLFLSLLLRDFIISLGILLLNYFLFFLFWILVGFTYPAPFVLYYEAAIFFLYAGIGGSIRTSISVRKVSRKLFNTEKISKDVINRALKSTLSLSIIGILLLIFGVLFESLGILVFY